jgi:hypothetical protein
LLSDVRGAIASPASRDDALRCAVFARTRRDSCIEPCTHSATVAGLGDQAQVRGQTAVVAGASSLLVGVRRGHGVGKLARAHANLCKHVGASCGVHEQSAQMPAAAADSPPSSLGSPSYSTSSAMAFTSSTVCETPTSCGHAQPPRRREHSNRHLRCARRCGQASGTQRTPRGTPGSRGGCCERARSARAPSEQARAQSCSRHDLGAGPIDAAPQPKSAARK